MTWAEVQFKIAAVDDIDDDNIAQVIGDLKTADAGAICADPLGLCSEDLR